MYRFILLALVVSGCATRPLPIDFNPTFNSLAKATFQNASRQENEKALKKAEIQYAATHFGNAAIPARSRIAKDNVCGQRGFAHGQYLANMSQITFLSLNEFLGAQISQYDKLKSVLKIKVCLDWESFQVKRPLCDSASINYNYYLVYEPYFAGEGALRASNSCSRIDPNSDSSSVQIYASPPLNAVGTPSDADNVNLLGRQLNAAENGLTATNALPRVIAATISADPNIKKAVEGFVAK